MGVSRRSISIGSTDFSPSFLQQHHPNLVIVGFAKDGTITAFKDRDVIINNDFFWLALLANYEFIDSFFGYLHVVIKNPGDSFRVFSN